MSKKKRSPADKQARREAELDQVYEKVIDVGCKGLCSHSCGPIDMSPAEKARIEARTGQPFKTAMRCPLLDFMGRCSVYDIRPIVCRLWGAVPEMPCPYGCQPTLTRDEGLRIMAEALHAGGDSAAPHDWSDLVEALLEDPQTLAEMDGIMEQGRQGDERTRERMRR